jgi:branched-subunit amino acid ABC-type transport system permease component
VIVDFVQNTLDGLMLGSAYALLALGFTLIFGVLRRANLAYGPAIMLGAYAATWVNLSFQPGLFVLALVTIAGATLAGAYVERRSRRWSAASRCGCSSRSWRRCGCPGTSTAFRRCTTARRSRSAP